MFVFNIFLGNLIQPYIDCMKSQKMIYPDIITISDWNCPIKQPDDPCDASDILRIWILSLKSEALYLDADIQLNKKIEINKNDNFLLVDLPEYNSINYNIIYHKNNQKIFSDMLEYYQHVNSDEYWPMIYIHEKLRNSKTFSNLDCYHHYVNTKKRDEIRNEKLKKLYGVRA